MKKIFIVLTLVIFPFIAFSETITGKVVKVSDGDTFTLLAEGNTQIKVRLQGVDCPEKKQDFGQEAKQFTSDAVFQKTVNVEITDTDFYGRKIGIVWLNASTTLNIELLKNGLAWHYKQYDKSVDYANAEKSARESKIGLWAKPNPVAPWEWRKTEKQHRNK